MSLSMTQTKFWDWNSFGTYKASNEHLNDNPYGYERHDEWLQSHASKLRANLALASR